MLEFGFSKHKIFSVLFLNSLCVLMKLSKMFIGKSTTKLQHLSDINHQMLPHINLLHRYFLKCFWIKSQDENLLNFQTTNSAQFVRYSLYFRLNKVKVNNVRDNSMSRSDDMLMISSDSGEVTLIRCPVLSRSEDPMDPGHSGRCRRRSLEGLSPGAGAPDTQEQRPLTRIYLIPCILCHDI